MQVHKTSRFFSELEVIIDFIAQDSFPRAEQFKNNLDDKVQDLPHFPYKCRRSQKSNDESIRDLVFQGYVIPYRVNSVKERIEVLGIFSENEWGIS
ncbi:MAG: type II toxin-antitoxin system RelE/ParE family toxin [Sulfurimonas sp.]|jgi:plasmid stabilization system protein ParE